MSTDLRLPRSSRGHENVDEPDTSGLGDLQQLLLVTDGTMTQFLATCMGEEIEAVRLSQHLGLVDEEPLAPTKGRRAEGATSVKANGAASHWTTRSLKAHEVLWFEGELADEIAFVVEGELDVLRERRRIAGVSRGHMLGEVSAFLDAELRTATVRARTPTRLLIVGKSQLTSLRVECPELYGLLLDRALVTLAQRVESTGQRLARLTEGTLPRPRLTAAVPVEAANPDAGGKTDVTPPAEVVLRRMPNLTTAEAPILREITAALTPRLVPAGTTLILEGEPGDSLFLLASGRFSVLRSVGSHTATHIGTLMSGSLFGTGAFLLKRPRNASCVALEDSWVLEMSRAAFTRLVGVAGRTWREALLPSLRDQLVSASSHLARLEAIRAERTGRDDDAEELAARFGATVIWPSPDSPWGAKIHATAQDVLRRLFRHRRLLTGSGPCIEKPCDECLSLHLLRVERAVTMDVPVRAVLPAFPAKSPSPAKTLTRLPDMAEEQALRYLQRACDEVREIYAPGLEVTICSDGRVFSDLVGVTDNDVTAYGRAVAQMISELGLRSLKSFNLEDLFKVTTFEAMRDHLLIHYAEPVHVVAERARTHEAHRRMLNGIQRFLFEDAVELERHRSRTQIRNGCKLRAHRLVQRSNAWARLVAECFPEALRLSIHPQPPHSEKIGILLGEAEDSWLTPWHGVALREGDRWRIVKRRAAEEMGAVVVQRNGIPSHYELPS